MPFFLRSLVLFLSIFVIQTHRVLADTAPWFPKNISADGDRIDNLVIFSFWLTGAFFVVVVTALILFPILYRNRPGHKAYYTHGTGLVERLITFALAATVFGAIDLNVIHRSNEDYDLLYGKQYDRSQCLRIEVQGRQFEWRIRYSMDNKTFGTATDITTLDQLHIPVNRPIFVQVTSGDVIHSFYLPNMRVRQDAMPGLVTQVAFEAMEKGQYTLACSELCGLGHYRMKGYMTVEDEADFEKFLADAAKDRDPDPANNWGWGWEER
jgi:cytochrome c oxidase subunit II